MFRGSDSDTDQYNADEGLKLRVGWVHRLRAALTPLATGTVTQEDVERARAALDETREWLSLEWAGGTRRNPAPLHIEFAAADATAGITTDAELRARQLNAFR